MRGYAYVRVGRLAVADRVRAAACNIVGYKDELPVNLPNRPLLVAARSVRGGSVVFCSPPGCPAYAGAGSMIHLLAVQWFVMWSGDLQGNDCNE